MDVWDYSSSCNNDISQQLRKLLIISHSQLNVSWGDPCLPIVSSSFPRKLQYLSTQVLQHGSDVDGGTSSNPFRVPSFSKVASDPSNGELKSCLLRLAYSFLRFFRLLAFIHQASSLMNLSFSWHRFSIFFTSQKSARVLSKQIKFNLYCFGT